MIRKLIREHREIFDYLVVGVLTTAFSWSVYALVRIPLDMGDPVQVEIAVFLRWLAGVIFAYFTNRRYVFHSSNPHILQEGLKFASSRVVTLLTEMLLMWLLVSVMGINDWIATLACAVIITVLNYVFSKLMNFKKK